MGDYLKKYLLLYKRIFQNACSIKKNSIILHLYTYFLCMELFLCACVFSLLIMIPLFYHKVMSLMLFIQRATSAKPAYEFKQNMYMNLQIIMYIDTFQCNMLIPSKLLKGTIQQPYENSGNILSLKTAPYFYLDVRINLDIDIDNSKVPRRKDR